MACVKPYRSAWQRSLDRPPLKPGVIQSAMERGCNYVLPLNWQWFTPRAKGMWNRYGPPDEWLIEVLQHVNRYLRENRRS